MELRGRNSEKHSLSADSKGWIFPHPDPDVGGYVGKIIFIFSTVPRARLYMKQEPNKSVLI